jgi:hypothetical protein
MRSRIMYVEYQGPSRLAGDGRIARVTFSKTRRTIYYNGQKLKPIKHPAGRANYVDIDTGQEYWVSGPKHDGNDTLWPGLVRIEPDVREEYWRDIRHEPEHVEEATFRSEGKHSKRPPRLRGPWAA